MLGLLWPGTSYFLSCDLQSSKIGRLVLETKEELSSHLSGVSIFCLMFAVRKSMKGLKREFTMREGGVAGDLGSHQGQYDLEGRTLSGPKCG